jgi:hypothetical protein
MGWLSVVVIHEIHCFLLVARYQFLTLEINIT